MKLRVDGEEIFVNVDDSLDHLAVHDKLGVFESGGGEFLSKDIHEYIIA